MLLLSTFQRKKTKTNYNRHMASSSSAAALLMKITCVVMLMCMVVILVAPPNYAEAAMSCGQVLTYLSPCINYLRSRGERVPPGCCNGVKDLNNAARSTPDRKAVCNCLKSAAGRSRDLNFQLAGALPARCGVNIPYKISPSTRCDNVK